MLLYGPPAGGKLTVAKELARKTGYPIFHNHLTANLASAIFPSGTRAYSDLAEELRITCLRAAIHNRLRGLIMTFAYGVETYKGKSDNRFIKRMARIIRRSGGEVYFVRLTASPQELSRRVSAPKRRKDGKLTNPRLLKYIIRKYRMYRPIPGIQSMTVDTTSVSPAKTAKLIRQYCRI